MNSKVNVNIGMDSILLQNPQAYIWQLFIITKQPVHISITVVFLCIKDSMRFLRYLTYCYLQAIKRCPNIVGTPPNCLMLYWDDRASMNMHNYFFNFVKNLRRVSCQIISFYCCHILMLIFKCQHWQFCDFVTR